MYTFVFNLEKPFKWKAGQHSIFWLPNIKEKSWRVFSIASSSEEKKLIISTRIGKNPSEFKTRLLKLKKGDTVSTRGPLGPFYISQQTRIGIGIAGGIGITPFRSLLFELSTKKDLGKVKFHLIYSDKNKQYLYSKKLKQYEGSSNIKIYYTTSKEEVENRLNKLITKFGKKAEYFISGAPEMIRSVKKHLEENGIKNIKNDPFYGY